MSDLGSALRDTARAGSRVQLIETHISWVLLAGDFAWKIKKPVALEFADFSTLQKREHFCEEELRLNRRLAPELYLGLVAITGTPEVPALEGEGTPIGFAVKMRRFPQSQLLGEVVSRGELTPRHIDELAATVAGFHQRIEVAPAKSVYASPEAVWQPVQANFDYFDRHIAGPERRTLITATRQRMTQRWASLAGECAARGNSGFVRECHGDMHLGNMVLIDDEVTIFDAIDFNPGLRWIDVVSEVAFIVMDLERRERPDLAYRFLNQYCDVTGDYSGVRLLPFYVAHRALVRAKVKAIRSGQQPGDDAPSTIEQRKFDTLLRLASASTEFSRPRLFITHGFSGSGKTTFTQSLLERLGGIRVRSDVERKRLHQGGCLGGDLYSTHATRQTYQRLADLTDVLLDSRLPVIVDATFLKREHRDQFRRIADRRDAAFVIIDLQVPPDVLKTRVSRRHAVGTDASDADTHVIAGQRQTHEPLDPDEQPHVFTVRATDAPQSRVKELTRQTSRLSQSHQSKE